MASTEAPVLPPPICKEHPLDQIIEFVDDMVSPSYKTYVCELCNCWLSPDSQFEGEVKRVLFVMETTESQLAALTRRVEALEEKLKANGIH